MALTRPARLLPALLLAALTLGGSNHVSRGADAPIDGTLVPDHPIQLESTSLAPFSVEQYQITPAAEFSLRALVLSTTRYNSGREAELSPVDLALGWGPMSDRAVLERIRITQGERRYYYRWSDVPPIPRSEIVEHSTNMHVIPADEDVKRVVESVRAGQIVELSGYLVRIQAPGGWQWNSSLTRADTGDGACEVMWVKEIEVR